jgi:outer membrane protein assembly factor BamB
MARVLRFVVGALAVAALGGGPGRGREAAPDDWPHLRGPNYDAVSRESGLTEAWPERGPPVLWTRELGQGYSGFVAVGNRVFTQFQTRSGQYVLCLEAATGGEVWRQRVDWSWQTAGAYPGPYATPTWADGRVYYASPTGQVGCLEADTGRQVWAVPLARRFRGEGTEFGYAATPLVEAGRVILPVGGPGASLVALDTASGATAWSAGDDPASYCPGYPITFRGRRLVVGFLRNSIAVHDLATGKRLWRQELSRSYDEHSAWPLYAEPDLLFASPFRSGATAYRLAEEGGGLTGRPRWASRDLSNDVCSSVLVGGYVYGFDLAQLQASAHRASRGRFKCLDFTTGAVRWETDRVGQATVLAADGKLFLLSDTGTLILARADPSAYVELARTCVLDGEICWTPPTLHRGRLFLRSPSRAVCLFVGPADDRGPGRPAAELPPARWSFDWGAVLGREPDYPHDAPLVAELARWYAGCVGVFGGASLLAALAGLLSLAARSRRPGWWARAAFAASAFLLGLAGTATLSTWADALILTWPVSLYVGFRLAVAAARQAGARPRDRRVQWAARAVGLLFVGLCFGYYQACVAVGYLMAWSFLAGFLPAAPAAVVAARSNRAWVGFLADGVGFSVFFWAGGLLPGWKAGTPFGTTGV